MSVYLISPTKIRANAYVDGNVSEASITTSITLAQETMLEPLIGTPLYDRLVEDVTNDTLNADYKSLLVDKVHPVLTYYVVYQLINTQIFKISNSGINKQDVDNSEAIDLTELRSLRESIRSIYSAYENQLTKYLLNNTELFTEYDDESEDGYEADTSVRSSTVFNYNLVRRN